jgi:hypothetical protein
MDKDALQQQLNDMEDASEQWRSEKRRLNAEIDKLEAALADARSTSHKKAGSSAGDKSTGVDPALFARLQEAADEKFNRASEEWRAERTKLLSQIDRLEGAVADAIARASNPLRATQSLKEQFEIELNQAIKEKTEIEQAFLRAKTQWEQEKLKMTGEMVKLRRAAQIMGRPVPKDDAPEVNPKVRDLEEQLKQNLAHWNAERENLTSQIHKLEEAARQWDTERRQLNDHAGQLQQAFMQTQAKLQSHEVASRSPNPAVAQVEELRKDKHALQQQLLETRNEWDKERRELNSQIERMDEQLQRVSETRDRVSQEVVDQLRLQYEQRLQEAIQQKLQLAQQLQSASSLLETERARLSAAQKGSGSGSGFDTESITKEVARVEGQLNEIISVIDNPDTELSTVIRKNVEKAELDAYLKGILFTLGRK